jgi:fibro-slime domain-containing protein
MGSITGFATWRCICAASVVAALIVTPAAASPDPPKTLELTGTVRDFHERTAPHGHTDFERKPDAGFGLYCGNVALELDDQGKPVFVGGGRKVKTQFEDTGGHAIAPHMFDRRYGADGTLVPDPGLDDEPGEVGPSSSGGVTSADSFRQWYRDVLGTNLSKPLTVTLVRQDGGTYVFDDKSDPVYSGRGGFFPIDDELFGNSAGSSHNYHFTFELHTEFTYDAGAGQIFRFIGDDDVWVFIDGRLAIDLGGVHAAKEQFIDLDRMNLTDGETYALDFFFAERHRTQSNFRIETNLVLEDDADLPPFTAAFD